MSEGRERKGVWNERADTRKLSFIHMDDLPCMNVHERVCCFFVLLMSTQYIMAGRDVEENK